jgi:hypothetical protein
MMNNKPRDIEEKTKVFALRIIRLYFCFAENNRISGTRQTDFTYGKWSRSGAGLISFPAGPA